MPKSAYQIQNGLFVTHKARQKDKARFEQILRFEKKENRLHDDGEVRELPKAFAYNLHRDEWEQTEQLIKRFEAHLGRQFTPTPESPIHVLIVSCGNGWLANRLANRSGFQVIGIEDREWQIQQAARIFYRPNLKFIQGDINRKAFAAGTFDLIVLHKGTHLYPRAEELIENCLTVLKPEGQLHLLENMIFPKQKLEPARAEFGNYVQDLDCAEALPYLHLHDGEILKAYTHSVLSRSSVFQFSKKTPLATQKAFQWVRVQADKVSDCSCFSPIILILVLYLQQSALYRKPPCLYAIPICLFVDSYPSYGDDWL